MRPKPILILALTCLIAAAGAMLMNQHTARSIANDIQRLDQDGKAVEHQLNDLKQFSRTHINASVKLYMQGSYKRALAKAQKEAATTSDASVYQRAQSACSQGDSVQQARCVTAFVNANSQPGKNPQPVAEPDRSQFEYKLVSPVWTPDLAGALTLGGLGLIVMAGWIHLRLR